MSDDTPTERFDAAGNAPTERFAAPGDAPTERLAAPSPEVVEERKSRRLIIVLAVIGGLLLIAVLIVLVLLLTRGTEAPVTPSASPTVSASPTASASASPSPTPTPTETTPPPPPPSTDASVDDFTINGQTGTVAVDCAGVTTVDLTLVWATANADHVFFGVDTNDASQGAFFSDDLPASGNSDSDFPDGFRPFQYTCGAGSHKYVFTAVKDGNGTKDSVAIKVTG